jgi:D-alanine-D-alanine ligase
VKHAAKPRVMVAYNRDFEGSEADPENKAREEVRCTADDVVGALAEGGIESSVVGVGDDLPAAMAQVTAFAPDVVFNLCESLGGDNSFEPLMPLLLEYAGIAYTGAPPLALSLALHKHKAKDVLRAAGVPTPEGLAVASPAELTNVRLPFPLIVKPTREDASVGITSASVVHDRAGLKQQVTYVTARYRQPALVERYIDGREIYVAMLGRKDGGVDMLPLSEIDFTDMPAERPRIVSFEGKWAESSAEFRGTKPVPCVGLTPEAQARIAEVARIAFAAMELRDYARLDLRLAPDGTPYVIDVNPNCDLSAASGGFARAGRAAGISYDELIRRIVDLALQRRPHADTIPLAVRSRAAGRNHLAGGGFPAAGDRDRDRAARRRARSG